jgi:hypothetical protein
MFELSGFRDATTAGDWRHRNLLEPSASGAHLSSGRAPKDERLLETPMRGPFFHWTISFTQGREDYRPRKLATNRHGRGVSAGRATASIQIPVNAENRRLAKYAKHYSKSLLVFSRVNAVNISYNLNKEGKDISIEYNL